MPFADDINLIGVGDFRQQLLHLVQVFRRQNLMIYQLGHGSDLFKKGAKCDPTANRRTAAEIHCDRQEPARIAGISLLVRPAAGLGLHRLFNGRDTGTPKMGRDQITHDIGRGVVPIARPVKHQIDTR